MKKLNTEKLSIAIRQALDDLRACEKDERYKIIMADWHVPGMSGACEVCLAGAVMAKRLGASPDKGVSPWGYGRAKQRMLLALDHIRKGNLITAIRQIREKELNIPTSALSLSWLSFSDYRHNPGKFKRCLSRVADMLERRGL